MTTAPSQYWAEEMGRGKKLPEGMRACHGNCCHGRVQPAIYFVPGRKICWECFLATLPKRVLDQWGPSRSIVS